MEQLETYVKSLIPRRDSIVEEMERQAERDHVPIMDIIAMEFLLQQLKLMKPERILEIGTAIGYSAIRMSQATGATVVTIEREEQRYEQALENIQRVELESKIHVWFGDALNLVEKLESLPHFDVLFIDAAKGQYQRFFELYEPYVKRGGVIFSDNVLFRGLVAEAEVESKRLRNLTEKIKTYNSWLMAHPRYDTRIVPVGDGLAISIKR
ncbi:O-methyltransferase [Halalkalibacter sp. APA_J-10(15)]|uniref:O-methyltransferase n=1 Tax=Halalkalibacter sp. APA_J-10(15) TaxID=2933805 RepID=UPI001FF465B5|nr:O-methyltransferase [Halalkalibacter sp. APA_J-10(15)]MCK0470920.1 O-methyltransferase [Halalkalibacter sp. APA_J-10(15)]